VNTVLLVVAIVAGIGLLGWAVYNRLQPTEEELHIQRGAELERRLGSVTERQLRDMFIRLAYGSAEQQHMLEMALETPEALSLTLSVILVAVA
jgi:type II secretory pathway component PulJ